MTETSERSSILASTVGERLIDTNRRGEVSGPVQNLEAWKVAMEMVISTYRLTSTFPAEEKYGLVAQLRRSAVSVPSNIAEGAARSSAREFSRFLFVARGSLAEWQTQLEISYRLGFIENGVSLQGEASRLHALTNGLLKKLEQQ